jgi:hypothetical protein
VAERARVHEHFLRVERRVRRASLRGLGPVQRLTRALLLDELGRYRRARRYPINRDFAGKQVPYFIDEAHTRCAVAHLLEVGGQADLVQKIARERNHARVRELANEAALVHWLRAAGLSLEEAALIQPSYCTLPNPGTVAAACCRFVGSSTLLEGTIVAGEAGLTPHFVIDGIYGMPADFKVGAALYQVGDLGLQVGEQALLEVNGTSFAMQDMIHFDRSLPRRCEHAELRGACRAEGNTDSSARRNPSRRLRDHARCVGQSVDRERADDGLRSGGRNAGLQLWHLPTRVGWTGHQQHRHFGGAARLSAAPSLQPHALTLTTWRLWRARGRTRAKNHPRVARRCTCRRIHPGA